MYWILLLSAIPHFVASAYLCEPRPKKIVNEDGSLHRKIVLKKAPPSITNIFSYATVNISTDEMPFVINGLNNPGYLVSLITSTRSQTWYIQDKISCFEDFKLNITLDQPCDVYIDLMEKKFDQSSFILFLLGCVLLVEAKFLSRSTSFLYASCASVGIIASCLVILFVLYRLIPYKRIMGFFITVGSGMWFYFLNHLQNILGSIILKHPYHVTAYLLFSALISLSLLYYFGVPDNDRTLNLLQWFMQLMAIYIIYFSCYSKAFAITIIVLLVIFQFISFSKTFFFITKLILPRKFIVWLYPPPALKFLTLEEYEQQAREETEKGLKELQQFCKSPDCNTWAVVSRIKDPKKFAEYLQTGNQFTNDEEDMYFVEDDEEEECPSKANNDLPNGNGTNSAKSTQLWISDDEKEQTILLTDD